MSAVTRNVPLCVSYLLLCNKSPQTLATCTTTISGFTIVCLGWFFYWSCLSSFMCLWKLAAQPKQRVSSDLTHVLGPQCWMSASLVYPCGLCSFTRLAWAFRGSEGCQADEGRSLKASGVLSSRSHTMFVPTHSVQSRLN